VIGAGGLGSPAAFYLAAAGVGRIGLADGDKVDLSNLQRQILHSTSRVGEAKTASAATVLCDLNPNVELVTVNRFVTDDNIGGLISDYDFVIDATDSMSGKRLINDTCVRVGKPLSHGAIWRYFGQTITVLPGTPCYSCLFETDPEESQARGPLGVTAGIIGTIQAAEAIKYLAGVGELLTSTLLRLDTLTMDFTKVKVALNPECKAHQN
ncbi:MAG: HesA/MoeB/ThiF family protein, partial [Paramuribaculum sp.]|nr:HesA/MoeB/ThiF family protein [Paramuribaculum sp.]